MPAAPVNTRRVWLAIGLGTTLQTISYGSLLFGAIVSQSDDPTGGGSAFALGFLLAPTVFAVVAFVSGHPRAPLATLKGMGLWLIVALPFGLLNPVTGLTLGFTAAAAVTLRGEEGLGRIRSIAVVAAGVWVSVLVFILPEAGIFAGAVTPLLAIRAADVYAETRNA